MNTKYQKTLFVQFWRISSIFMILAMFISAIGINPVNASPDNTPLQDGISQYPQSALVLVNSQSADYLDFQHFIQPYLDHFGIPYTTLDISTTPINANVNEYALLIIGHRNLDSGATRYLSAVEEGFISGAVNSGSGLVNFDNYLSANGTNSLYQFITDVFTFGYNSAVTGSDVTFADSSLNYIIARHTNNQVITTNTMSLAGITLPDDVTSLASSSTQPFIAVTNFGSGRAVQFGSYDWISHAVKGPLFGLDDLFWRSMVWAARKPFVMRGMPPFVTMRMDDTVGPLDWVHISNEYGFIPWLGIFPEDMAGTTVNDLKGLVDDRKATAAIHAWASGTSHFFYFDHNNGQNYPDETMSTNFADGTAWFTNNHIAMSTYLVPHYYEIGSNALTGVENWGIQYIGTIMDPGQLESNAPWMNAGPFRLYENGTAYDRNHNIYYSDFVPGTDNKLFNCITELRDITGYEWLGTSGHTSVAAGIADGTEWLNHSFDSMALGTLFSHEYAFVPSMSMTDWRTIISGITQNIAGYNPQYVSMDRACQYVRALKTSHITGAIYDSASKTITTSFAGKADLPTQYYVFNEAGGVPQQILVNGASSVPAFDNGTQATFTLPGALDHISVTPNPASVVAGATKQFSAQGYDASNNPIPGLSYTWSVALGGGIINPAGLFTAGIAAGHFENTVVAAVGSIAAAATVDVTTPPLDHFTFDTIASPQYAGVPFRVTIAARDADGNTVVNYAGQVQLSASGGGTLAPTQSGTFSLGKWTGPLTLSQIATGVTLSAADTDKSGNSNAFDVETMRACPCSIWEGTGTPILLDENDGQPIEVGVKFRSSVDGYITALRFYKATSNTGTHVGHLWSSAGNQLTEATFTGESASGWQEVTLGAPVAVSANTTYIASYHSSANHYSSSVNYFTAAIENQPVRALANGEDGPNGVYKYGASGFPSTTYQSSNYWVDVVFNTTVGPDKTPPFVNSVTPKNNDSNVSISANISAVFNEPLDVDTVSGATFELRDSTNALVPATVTYNNATRTVTLDPTEVLAYSRTYLAKLIGGTSGIKDVASNALASDYIWSFTTASEPPPPPTEGPGGPILVVSAASNPFSRYYVEILRAEGLNEFFAIDITQVTPAVLNNYDVVILGEMPLTTSQVTMFTDWTNAGGNLIAMRPDSKLAGLLGLASASTTLSEGYLLVNTASAPGAGIVNQTIQFHGTADRYNLNNATAVAMLYSNATTPTSNPAVTLRSVGANGGQAAAFIYDLAKSIVYTRQGNPVWQSINGDGSSGPVRADDMFHNGTDLDWVNLDKVAIPQADEQQRLLANMILSMNADNNPLPRFWYLPKGLKAAIVETGDDHGDAGMAPRFDIYRNASPANCSVDDWECVRATGYLYLGSSFTPAQATFYKNLGFEVSLHINTDCNPFTASEYEGIVASQSAAFSAKYPDISLVSNRNHCISFPDWSTTPEIESAHGMRLDTNYYYWPESWVQNRPGMFTGSGFPMRFAKLDGSLIDTYQAVTQMPDESGLSFPSFVNTLLDRANGSEGYYGVFTTNMHFDTTDHAGSNAIVESAKAHGVPVVSAQQMLTWLDGRNGSSFGNLNWSGNALSFSITAATGSRNMRAMLPITSAIGLLGGITQSGNPVSYTIQTIKGIQYAFFPANTGNYVATYSADTTAPTVTVVSPVSDTTDIDVNTTVTATFSESIDPLTLNSGGFELRDAGNTLIPVTISYNYPTATLTPNAVLAPNMVYTSKLKGGTGGVSDMAGNPLPTDYTWSFTTAADSCPCSIWNNTGTPTTSPVNDNGQPIEVGTKFRSDTAGYITSLRYYMGAGDTDTHVGHLWASTGGSPLATVTFASGTAYGWQEMALPAPVLITANTTYIVSIYSSPLGNFAITPGGLTNAVTNSPLKALAAGEDGPNGVYRYGGGFPNGGNNANYWVDVVFQATLPGDTTPPIISAMSATPGTEGTATVTWTTNEPSTSRMDYGTASDALTLNATSGALVTSHSLSLTGLTAGTTYYYRVTSEDAAGNSTTSPTAPANPLTFVTPAPDTAPPVISSVSAVPGANGSATIKWSTDELSTSRVDYGNDSGNLNLNVSATALVTTHSLALSALLPNTTYYYRVTSADAATNNSTAPSVPAEPLNFTTPAASFTDTTTTDFSAGNAACYIAQTTDGEVSLAPALGAEFDGTTFPSSNWINAPWSTYQPGGSIIIDSGMASIDESLLASTTFFSAGHVLDFVATFQSNVLQHAGFAVDFDGSANWAAFSTGSPAGSIIKARTMVGGSQTETATAAVMGVPHHFRIVWTATNVVYYIDDMVVPVATHTASFGATQLRPAFSDLTMPTVDHTKKLNVDWVRMSPYASPCSFTSRVFDAGKSVNWDTISWTSNIPSGTSLGLSYRIGNTPTLSDVQWVALSGNSPQALAGNSQYIQYQAELSTSDPALTPNLQDVTFAYQYGADTTTPTISAVNALPGGSGNSVITWSTDEPSDSLVQYGTSPGSLGLSGTSATFVTGHTITLSGLTADTTYYYRVISKDAANNSATSPGIGNSPTSFNMPPVIYTTLDTAAMDFNAGSGSCPVDTTIGDGALRLPLTLDEGFSGTSLPTGWTSAPWSGGTSTVSDGIVTVSGARLTPTSTTGWVPTVQVPVVIEFVATFGAAQYQNAGLGAGDNSTGDSGMYATGAQPWAMFGTAGTTNTLHARLNPGGDVAIPNSANFIDSSHRYRIEWRTGNVVEFFIDGVSVNRRTATFGAINMRPGISDFNVASPSLTVDWLKLTPYISPCAFTSRVIDGGEPVHWTDLNATGSTPAGTSVNYETHTGNSAVPDESWSSWQAINSPIASPNGRYIQYRATLGTTDTAQTSVVESVALSYKTLTTPTITWNNPTSISYGTPLSAFQLNATASTQGTFTYSPNAGTVVNVGLHTLHADFTPTDTTKYLTASKDVTINVTQANATVTLNGLSQTYDGTPKLVTATTVPSGLNVDITYDGSATVPTNAGSYIVSATVNDPNYSSTASGRLVVAKADATVTLVGLTGTYDGTPKPVTVTTNPSGLTVDITYNSSSVAPTAAGSYAVSVAVNDINYAGSASGTLQVARAGSITAISGGGTFVYDGNPHAATVTVTGAGNLNLSPASVYSGACSASPVIVTDTPCTAAYTYAGDTNHEGSTGSTSITITPAAATVTLDNLIQTYTGTPKSVTATTFPAGLVMEVRYDGSLTPPTALGNYAVAATVINPNYTGSANGTLVIEKGSATHSVSLVPGWNLVSFNVQPVSTDIATVLSSLAGNYDLVYAWNAGTASNNWLKYAPSAPQYSNTLSNLDEKKGFWIHMTAADTLEVTGKVPVTTDINLSTAAGGWNLVAYPSGTNSTLPEALRNNGANTDFAMVYAYHANSPADPWKLFGRTAPAWANDLTELAPGWGYWVKVSANHTWSVKYLAGQ